MPQLDISVFAPQIVWLTITFLAMYFLMAKVALPRIAQVLDERQTRIDDNLEKAAALKKEAEDAATAYESSLAQARSKLKPRTSYLQRSTKTWTLQKPVSRKLKTRRSLTSRLFLLKLPRQLLRNFPVLI